MMSNRLEFKGRLKGIYFYLFSINALLTIVLFVLGELNVFSALILFVLVNIFYISTIIFKLFKIIIDRDKSILEIHYMLDQLRKATIIPLTEIKCSFNDEVLARGGRAKILKIEFGGKVLVKLMSEYNGWNEENLILIFEQLNDVKKLDESPKNKANS